MRKKRILIVEDETIVAMDLEHRLTALGYDIAGTAMTGDEAIEIVRTAEPDIILMDIQLKGPIDGIESTERLQQIRDVPVIFLSAYTDSPTLERAKITAPFGYLVKPFQTRELYSCIEMALYKHEIDRQIREKQEQLDTVLQGIGDLVLVTDTERRLTSVNRAAVRVSGYGLDALIGMSISDLCMELSPDEIQNETSARSFLKTAAGPTIPVELTVSPLGDRNGSVFGYVYVIRDISERIRQEQILRSAKEDIERAFKMKREFLATISHELRTPLKSILGMADLSLESLGDEEAAAENLRVIRQSGQNLLRLIDSILEYSSVEGGTISMREGAFSLRDLVEEAVVLLAEASKEKDLEIYIHVEPACAGLYRGDKARIRQVIENLVGNGIKFTEKGAILIHAKDESGSTGRKRDIHISVKDSGIGIPEDRLDDIFDAFSQVDSSFTRAHGGSGLGLAIVKRTVETMGGRVWVLSKLGSGSEFHVFLPLDAEGEKQIRAALQESVSIVIASGNALRQRILHDMCLNLGIPASRISILHPSRIDEMPVILKRDEAAVCLLDSELRESAGALLAEAERGETGDGREPYLSRIVLVLRTKKEKPLLWKELRYSGLSVSFPFRSDDLADAIKDACAFFGKTGYGVNPLKQRKENDFGGIQAPVLPPSERKDPGMLSECIDRIDQLKDKQAGSGSEPGESE